MHHISDSISVLGADRIRDLARRLCSSSSERSRIKRGSLMCFHRERSPDCISLSDESDILPFAITQTAADGK